jgi:phosphate/sulfate permease
MPEGAAARVGCLMAAAMVAAPFLALRFGTDAGLAVATAALIATAVLARGAARDAVGDAARRMVVAAWANTLLAAAMVALLVVRILGS